MSGAAREPSVFRALFDRAHEISSFIDQVLVQLEEGLITRGRARELIEQAIVWGPGSVHGESARMRTEILSRRTSSADTTLQAVAFPVISDSLLQLQYREYTDADGTVGQAVARTLHYIVSVQRGPAGRWSLIVSSTKPSMDVELDTRQVFFSREEAERFLQLWIEHPHRRHVIWQSSWGKFPTFQPEENP